MNFFCVDDWELLLYLFRIFCPLIAFALWIKDSSLTELFDNITIRLMSTAQALLEFWQHTCKKKPVSDNERVTFNITSKVENLHSEKVSVKWLISWKPMPEKSGEATSSDCLSEVSITREPSTGSTNVTFYDSNGTKFNINTSIRSLVGDSQSDARQQNSEENSDPPSGKTD